MERAEKDALVSTLNGIFTDANVVVVTHYSGLNVAQLSELRTSMAEAGASFRVTKNRLAKRALEGTPANEIADLFTGPCAIGISDDPVAAPRILAQFAKKNDKLVIRGGIMGETVLDENGIKALAELPSLDELRGKIVGMLNTPATRIAGVLAAPGGQIARVIAAKAEQGDAA
ncbi:50S ribosomal protein L10 [Pyruvatibacter sp.]|uniref:50S ribosomal protein L10 n=1 Tax=Pyruvatibacter sp. TaxID=1981328 RepID=UPI0032EEB233